MRRGPWARWVGLGALAAASFGPAAELHGAPAAPAHSSRVQVEPRVIEKARTGVEFRITPETAVIHINGRKIGTAKNVGFRRLRPGSHTIRLVHGGDETEAEVMLRKGQVLKFVYSFE